MRALVPIAAILVTVACHSVQRQEDKPERILWKPIGSWSGHGSTQTGSFDMEAYKWRIRWEANSRKDPKTAIFRVTVASAISGRPLDSAVVDHKGDGHDVAYVEADPHTCYLVIEAPDMDWSVTVEEPLIEDTGGTGSPSG